MTNQPRQASEALPEGTIEAVGERGVWVPPGMTANEIMRGAEVLETMFEVEHYQARSMVREVLAAVRATPCDNRGRAGVSHGRPFSGEDGAERLT